MRLPSGWNPSRAAAFALAALLHVVVIAWLLSLRFELPQDVIEDLSLAWVPLPLQPTQPDPDPVAADLPLPRVAPVTAPPLPMPLPRAAPAPVAPADYSRSAREVARDMTAAPGYRPFGEVPKGPERPPKESYPPSIFEQPLPRVGTTGVTPDGETIMWVSDYCYVSISSRSIALKDVHEGRRGVRTCVLAQFGDEKKPRSDLFDPIKRPPPPQEPGCNRDGVGQSCGR